MSVKASKNRFSIDAETVLQAEASSPITATAGSTNTLSLDALSAYWNSGDLAMKHQFAIIMHVTAIDTGDGDETYVVGPQVDSVAAFSDSPVSLSTKTITSTGRYEFVVTREEVEAADANGAFIRLLATLGGTTPSLTYHAYVAPIVGD